ncbi:hypothetical protein [Duganella sp. Root336D2]|uniref:hypothetical protein n=1 Tax=Duganella sp. Root336D2 TaxID=1736518 RepID=UPI00070189D9|nr:hypothetical protein [Duganella sp. Root336D2]KQV54100.1 hypothetical protein ASD07_06060 [Duganella sp. Root336D2]
MNQPFDASIPVLTEIMKDEVPAAVAQTPFTEENALEWQALERRVAEQVLQQLSNRVDFVLEQRIKNSLAEVLEHALHALTAEIRAGLHDTIGKIVTRAVQQEITQLQAGSSRRD